MNQKQREYLVDQVSKNHRAQVEKLQAKIPQRPKLNNYLVAAFLDGSIQFNDMEKLRVKLRERALLSGTEGITVVEEDDDDGFSLHRRGRRIAKQAISIEASDLFVLPPEYVEALRIWKEMRDEINIQIEQLNASFRTVNMKLQIGSDKVLDKLIEQADNLADINLLNSAMVSLGGGENKQLTQ